MTNSTMRMDRVEEELLAFEVSDEALEAAAGMVKERAGSLTVAFCSGLDTCPGVTA